MGKSTTTTATEVAEAPPPPPPSKAEEPPRVVVEEESLRKCIWNGEKKEFLGRTCSSWIFITIFYLIFFFCLFTFFVVCWYISLTFIEPYEPYRQGEGGILGSAGPGLTVRPLVDRMANGASTLIWFQTGSFNNHQFWSEQLHEWFHYIPKSNHKNVKECVELVQISGSKTILNEKDTTNDKSCFVNPAWYGPCAEDSDDTFGYDRGEPCLLLKLNRIFGWIPEPFTWEEWKQAGTDGHLKAEDGEITVPKALAKYIERLASNGGGGGSASNGTGGSRKKRQADPTTQPPTPAPGGAAAGAAGGGSGPTVVQYGAPVTPTEAQALIGKYIMVWCDGEFDYDRETLGSIQYFPGPFIPAAYFPFKGQVNYQAPFLMLQLKRPVPGAMVSIVCQAYAKNIKQSRETGVGYTRFQVLIG